MSKAIELAEEAERFDATVTTGPWIAVQPRSQDGGIAIGHTGPTWDSTGTPFPAATSIRMAAKTLPLLPGWDEHAANATFIARSRTLVPEMAAELRRLHVEAEQSSAHLQSASKEARRWLRRLADDLEETYGDADERVQAARSAADELKVATEGGMPSEEELAKEAAGLYPTDLYGPQLLHHIRIAYVHGATRKGFKP